MNTEIEFNIGDILRAVAEGMYYPVIIILILFMLAAALLLGWLIAEYFTERRRVKLDLPALTEKLNQGGGEAEIEESALLPRQKEALRELCAHPSFSPELREALAVRLLDAEQEHYHKIIRLSELLARLAPMFGLLGTLIPLGPGIIALGQGDTFTLSSSMLTAFDTTVAGLLAAAVAAVVSQARKAWYKDYLSVLELLFRCVLDKTKEGAK